MYHSNAQTMKAVITLTCKSPIHENKPVENGITISCSHDAPPDSEKR